MQHPLLHFHKSSPLPVRPSLVAALLAWAVAFPTAAHAATLCVDQHGKAGCYNTISAAVTAAAPGDTVKVNPGVYHEDIVIKNPLYLIGRDRDSTIIDATGLSNGIFINGFDNPALNYGSLDEVTVTGFTVRNANYEGILANNVTHSVIWGNGVINNDQSRSGGLCPGLPAFETGEAASCGGGIHLIGAVHSTVSDNLVDGNATGVLLSDEATTTHDNVIARNLIANNKYGAGIVVASYLAYFPADQQPNNPALANGIYNNLVVHNQLVRNGGAGVVIVAPGAANRAYANSVVSNWIAGNGEAGIEIHAGLSTVSSAKNGDASRNAIVGNYIGQNGPDSYAPTTVATGISIGGASNIIDSLVTSNVVEGEAIAVAFNSASGLELHLNDLIVGHNIGVANLNAAGTVNATENWWGCPNGPGTGGCSTVTGVVTYSPFLTWPVDATGGHGHDLLFKVLPSYVPLLDFDFHEHGFDF